MSKLTALAARTLTKPGRHTDGDGLHLFIRAGGQKSWVLRFMRAGVLRDMGLGPFPVVSLAEARQAATAARALIRAGADPIAQRQGERQRAVAPSRTFRLAAERLIEAQAASWSNEKHAWQWRASLESFAYPTIGGLPVSDVTTEHVLTILRPIWATKSETASRVRGRVEAVLDAAKAMGWREGENPARWKGHLASLLPRPSRVRAVVHQPSLPWQQIPAFLPVLRGRRGAGVVAVEFAILTAARSGEVRGLRRGELDLEAKLWTVPAARMKGRKLHRVPLSAAALALLMSLHVEELEPDDLVFPGATLTSVPSDMTLIAVLRRMNEHEEGERPRWVDGQLGEPITVHGFRSTFRVWAGECTAVPREVVEAALAHAVGNEVEAAYARTDLLERRRALMESWGEFCRPAGTTALVADGAVPTRKRPRPAHPVLAVQRPRKAAPNSARGRAST